MTKYWLLAGVSAASLAFATPLMAAQSTAEAQGTSENTSGSAVSEVVVTGSHIVRNGNNSPTPVTVVNAEVLKTISPISLSAGLFELPEMQNDGPGHRIASQITGQNGNFVNLRNLGDVRTLVLLDGERVPATTYTGLVDVDIIPELLVSRVDIVTGGASAAYGSDAVAGVVNYILDDHFTGVKLSAQGGMSNYNGYNFYRNGPGNAEQATQQNCCDGKSYRIGGAFGASLLGDRAHVLFSVEHVHDDSVYQDARPSNAQSPLFIPSIPNTNATPAGTAVNPYTLAYDVVQANRSFTPKFLSGGPGITNMLELANGQIVPWDNGTANLGTSNYQVGGSGVASPPHVAEVSGLDTTQTFGRLSFDITPTITASVEALWAHNVSEANASGYAGVWTIFSGNPYLLPAIQAAMTANGSATTSVSMYIPESFPLLGQETTDDLNVTARLKGDIAGSWKFNAYYTYGKASDYNLQIHPNVIHALAAFDAVVNPADGTTVCRVTLTNPGLYPGCAPYNLFSYYGSSTAARSWVFQPNWYKPIYTTNDVAANFTGDFFHTWAGPISVAFGAEYRTRSLNMTSNSDPTIPVSTLDVGIRGVPATAKEWSFLNIQPISGSDNVAEGYFEAEIPLAKDMTLAKSLDLNGAVRETSYSRSGLVTTWKVGLNWQPVDDLKFRGNVSRDIRAPVLSELLGTNLGTGPVSFDPHCNCTGQYTIVSGGNPNLKPEFAQTYTAGVIYQPSWLPRFSVSLDWYKINITGAIALPPAANAQGNAVLQQCFAEHGTGPDCAYVVYPHPYSDMTSDNFPTQILAYEANIATLSTSGLDIEANYNFDLDSLSKGLSGNVALRALANYVGAYDYQAVPTAPAIHLAGWTDDNTSLGPIPNWKALFTAQYHNGPFGWDVQGRIVGGMKVGPGFIYADHNTVPTIGYVDTTVSYDLKIKGVDTEFFFTVNNLLNQVYPVVPGTTNPGIAPPTLYSLYDLMLRYYTLGAKVRF